jgi:hypothetical protein
MVIMTLCTSWPPIGFQQQYGDIWIFGSRRIAAEPEQPEPQTMKS